MIFPKTIIIVIILMGIFSCRKDDLSVDSIDDLEIKLKEEITNKNLTSISFCVVKNERLLYSNAYGYANKSTSLLAKDSTRYLIASISKTITAVALMQLVEQNLISLEDDISQYLPFTVRNPNFPFLKITFRMLLSHHSSISDNNINKYDLDCYGSDCLMTLEQFFKAVFIGNGQYYSTKNFTNRKPGKSESYSNLGSALIGYLIERITQIPFDVYCKNNIFIPLAMNNTEWRLSNTPSSELAIPYSSDISNSNPHYTFPDYPNGGLRTNVIDLSKFLRAIILDGSFEGTKILSSSKMKEMKTLQFGSSVQCLSFYYETINKQKLIGHSGGEKGVTTEMYFDPETSIGVIVFNNDDDADLNNIVSLLYNYGKTQ